jgi:hypothetical protein
MLAKTPPTRLTLLRQQNLALAPIRVSLAPPSLPCIGLIVHQVSVVSPTTLLQNPGNAKPVGRAPFDGVIGEVPSNR